MHSIKQEIRATEPVSPEIPTNVFVISLHKAFQLENCLRGTTECRFSDDDSASNTVLTLISKLLELPPNSKKKFSHNRMHLFLQILKTSLQLSVN